MAFYWSSLIDHLLNEFSGLIFAKQSTGLSQGLILPLPLLVVLSINLSWLYWLTSINAAGYAVNINQDLHDYNQIHTHKDEQQLRPSDHRISIYFVSTLTENVFYRYTSTTMLTICSGSAPAGRSWTRKRTKWAMRSSIWWREV